MTWLTHIERWSANENHRWYVLFVFVLLSYVYIYVSASRAPSDYQSSTAPSEEGEGALLLLPSRGGYRRVRGNPSTPSLLEWTVSEIMLLGGMVVFTVALAWYFLRLPSSAAGGLTWTSRVIEYILLWTHSVLLLLLLPINPFHTRILYNFRSWIAQICNDPLKELLMAFFFIVVLPLPGSTSQAERLLWLSLKIGVFYIGQSFLLGSPNYTLEPETDHQALPESQSQLIGYAVLLGMVLLIWAYSTFAPSSTKTSSSTAVRAKTGGT